MRETYGSNRSTEVVKIAYKNAPIREGNDRKGCIYGVYLLIFVLAFSMSILFVLCSETFKLQMIILTKISSPYSE